MYPPSVQGTMTPSPDYSMIFLVTAEPIKSHLVYRVETPGPFPLSFSVVLILSRAPLTKLGEGFTKY